MEQIDQIVSSLHADICALDPRKMAAAFVISCDRPLSPTARQNIGAAIRAAICVNELSKTPVVFLQEGLRLQCVECMPPEMKAVLTNQEAVESLNRALEIGREMHAISEQRCGEVLNQEGFAELRACLEKSVAGLGVYSAVEAPKFAGS